MSIRRVAAPPKRVGDAARTRAESLDVARSEFAAHWYHGARVDEIAAATRTTKRMIHYHFGGKCSSTSRRWSGPTAVHPVTPQEVAMSTGDDVDPNPRERSGNWWMFALVAALTSGGGGLLFVLLIAR